MKINFTELNSPGHQAVKHPGESQRGLQTVRLRHLWQTGEQQRGHQVSRLCGLPGPRAGGARRHLRHPGRCVGSGADNHGTGSAKVRRQSK